MFWTQRKSLPEVELPHRGTGCFMLRVWCHRLPTHPGLQNWDHPRLSLSAGQRREGRREGGGKGGSGGRREGGGGGGPEGGGDA